MDAQTILIYKTKDGSSQKLVFSLPPEISDLVVPKGSAAIDGVSLTVNEVLADTFSVNVIPHTAGLTTVTSNAPGQCFNLEADILGRYVKRLIEGPSRSACKRDAKDAKDAKDANDTNPGGGLTIAGLISQGF